jgi:GH35 family endo-1,4-beta-xylanase
MLGKPRKIQLLAVPASGYAFASWKVNNEIVSKEAAYLIDTDSQKTYQPEFTVTAYKLCRDYNSD